MVLRQGPELDTVPDGLVGEVAPPAQMAAAEPICCVDDQSGSRRMVRDRVRASGSPQRDLLAFRRRFIAPLDLAARVRFLAYQELVEFVVDGPQDRQQLDQEPTIRGPFARFLDAIEVVVGLPEFLIAEAQGRWRF